MTYHLVCHDCVFEYLLPKRYYAVRLRDAHTIEEHHNVTFADLEQ